MTPGGLYRHRQYQQADLAGSANDHAYRRVHKQQAGHGAVACLSVVSLLLKQRKHEYEK